MRNGPAPHTAEKCRVPPGPPPEESGALCSRCAGIEATMRSSPTCHYSQREKKNGSEGCDNQDDGEPCSGLFFFCCIYLNYVSLPPCVQDIVQLYLVHFIPEFTYKQGTGCTSHGYLIQRPQGTHIHTNRASETLALISRQRKSHSGRQRRKPSEGHE